MSRQASVLVTPGLGSTCHSKDVVFGIVSINIYTVKRSVGESPAVLEAMQSPRGSPSQPGTQRGMGVLLGQRGAKHVDVQPSCARCTEHFNWCEGELRCHSEQEGEILPLDTEEVKSAVRKLHVSSL